MYLRILKRWPKVDIEQKISKWSCMSCPNTGSASDRVQSKRPIETPGSLDHIF